jgi:paraquat-inducible protein B
MTDNEIREEQNLPLEQLILKKHKGISPIWILPFVALVIGSWFVFKTYTQEEIAIEIEFETGEGIFLDKTEVVYKGIPVGIVTNMIPKEDLTGVIVTAEIQRTAAKFLNTDTDFWLVKPRISLSGVSGIDTLFSGNYIGMQPGLDGKPTKDFIALIDLPPISQLSPGLHLTLNSDELGSISEGSEVLYRKMPVGTVQSYALNKDETGVDIRIYIQEDFQHLVKKESRFWNASGITVKGNLSGVKLRTESLSSVISGGIAFTNPDDKDIHLAESGDTFQLYDDYDLAEVGIEGIIHFDSGEGLSEDITKIVYEGQQVGMVRKIELEDDLSGIKAQVVFNPNIEHMLKKGTKFWKVGAKFSLQGVSGLETLIFGNYITFRPGKGEPQTEFYAQKDTPPINSSVPGLHLTLTSPVLGSLSEGSKIFYRKIPIGQVKSYEFSKGNGEVLIHVFIEPEAERFINANTKFYNASGVTVEASLPKKGITVRTESLASIISGGIAISTDVRSDSPKAKDRDQFKLFDGYDSANEKGKLITIEFPSAKGLSEGADVRYQGIKIGEIKSVKWFDNLKKVKVEALIYPEAETVARENSLFWIAVAEIGFRMKNVDTLLFGGFIQVKPGKGEPATDFVGLDYMPAGTYTNITSGVTVRLKAERARTIIRNDPVWYREMIIGKVVGFELSPDSKEVYILAYIQDTYKPLVRENTVFWNASGMQCGFGLWPLFSCNIAPIERMFAGGLSMATPPVEEAGDIVENGHIFEMHWKEKSKKWAKWNPGIEIKEGFGWKEVGSDVELIGEQPSNETENSKQEEAEE